jgi:hypothetical protein
MAAFDPTHHAFQTGVEAFHLKGGQYPAEPSAYYEKDAKYARGHCHTLAEIEKGKFSSYLLLRQSLRFAQTPKLYATVCAFTTQTDTE